MHIKQMETWLVSDVFCDDMTVSDHLVAPVRSSSTIIDGRLLSEEIVKGMVEIEDVR